LDFANFNASIQLQSNLIVVIKTKKQKELSLD